MARPGAQDIQLDLILDCRLLDAGHFALETHHQQVAGLMQDFLSRVVPAV